MVKFIGNWMFVHRLCNDCKPVPAAINIKEITDISEYCNTRFGIHVRVSLKNESEISIEGDIIEVLTKFQEHLLSSN